MLRNASVARARFVCAAPGPVAVTNRAHVRWIHRVANGHGNGVGFFSGPAARAPDPNRRRAVERLAGAKLRQHLPGESIQRSRMTEKASIRVYKSVQQRRQT